jgi:RecA-family ATPase
MNPDKESDHINRPGAGTPGPLRLWWHGDPDSNDRSFLIEGLLPEIGTAIMPGPWGSYKTFVAIDLAVSVMRRNTFAGRAINRRCGVLFIAAEGAFEIPIRLQAAHEEEGFENNLPLPFARADQCARLLDKSALAILKATADEAARHMKERYGVELGMIVIDTMAAAAGFDDENSNSETQRAMNVLKALADHAKCCVLVVDHFGKSAETGTRGGICEGSECRCRAGNPG